MISLFSFNLGELLRGDSKTTDGESPPIPGERFQLEGAKITARKRGQRIRRHKTGNRLQTLDHLIRSHPFWRGLDLRYFPLLNECATLVKFGANEPIFHAGIDAEFFYLIYTGRVSLETFVPGQGAVTIETLVSGQALGWSWLFPPYRWHFNAHSIELTQAVAFGAHSLRSYAEKNHDFGYELTRRMSEVMLQWLQATRLNLVEFYAAPTG
jgi:CRP/FNR family transcriptional regulator, cyclic AMP receptor protein